MRGLLARLDAYGTDEAAFREGHPEDRCPLCSWPVIDHYRCGYDFMEVLPPRAKWPHRRAAAFALLLARVLP